MFSFKTMDAVFSILFSLLAVAAVGCDMPAYDGQCGGMDDWEQKHVTTCSGQSFELVLSVGEGYFLAVDVSEHPLSGGTGELSFPRANNVVIHFESSGCPVIVQIQNLQPQQALLSFDEITAGVQVIESFCSGNRAHRSDLPIYPGQTSLVLGPEVARTLIFLPPP